MRKQRVEVYLDQETIEQIDEQLEDAGNSRSARIAYCINSQLQREELKNE